LNRLDSIGRICHKGLVLRSDLVSSRDYYDSGLSKDRFLAGWPFVYRFTRFIVGSLALFLAGSPSILQAQYTDAKIGEYLNYALAATNGSVYVGYNSIGYASPVIYTSATGWTGLPYSAGFDPSYPYYGYANGVSRDGTVVSGYTWGEVSNGVYVQYAVYWVNGTEQIVPAPPDDSHPTLMTANAVSGDGSTLLVEDTTGSNPSKVETYVYKIATQTFTSVGYLGTATQQTYGAALNYDGSIAAGYSNLDNGDNDGFRWTEKSGLQDLGVPQQGTFYVEPTCMSDDGTVIFGRYTVGGGWVGFRYTASNGFQDTAGISISGCTADGTEAFGIENLYFPAIWTTTVGSGYIDFLLKAHGINAKLGDLMAPVTISPDGSLLTSIGPFVYLNDQIWYGTYQIGLPSPLNVAPVIITKVAKLSTAYATTLTVRAPGVIEYAEFTTGATAAVVAKPKNAASFDLKGNGSFSYTPKNGYGGKTDSFTYHLIGPGGTSTTAQVKIYVSAP
jgi:hypothetical protein